jgi:nitrate reductase NapAB chaperone NapD
LLRKKAYVLIKVSAGKLDSVMRTLSEMPDVDSVEGVSGNCDLVAVMGGPDLETLQNTILSTVRGVEGIESTETWIVMVPQPDTWTREELERYVAECDETELMAIKALLDKGRSMMVQELIDELGQRLGDETFDVHSFIVALTNMTRRAVDQYRRERFVEFDPDMGYFLNERYIDTLKDLVDSMGSFSPGT